MPVFITLVLTNPYDMTTSMHMYSKYCVGRRGVYIICSSIFNRCFLLAMYLSHYNKNKTFSFFLKCIIHAYVFPLDIPCMYVFFSFMILHK